MPSEDGGVAEADADALRRLLPLLPALDVTRLADQTGLDMLGIPVAAAFRPNSRSIAVHQGKGLTRSAAKISAIMEAAECHLAENVDLPLRRATPRELPDTVAIDTLPREHGAAAPPTARFLWVEGRDLIAGRPKWVPFELVHADFTGPQRDENPCEFKATTNGMGAGFDLVRAQTHALWELLERDAVSTWRHAGGPAAADATPLDLDSVRDARCRSVLDRCRAKGVRVAVWQLRTRIAAPAFQALLVPPDGGLAGIEPEMGAALHIDPARALLGAVCEAAQSRVTRIAGARDDYDPASYGHAARAERLARATAWLALSARRQAVPFPDGSDPRPAGRMAGLDAHLASLARQGCTEAVWIDLGKARLPLSCGRFVVPMLNGPFTG